MKCSLIWAKIGSEVSKDDQARLDDRSDRLAGQVRQSAKTSEVLRATVAIVQAKVATV